MSASRHHKLSLAYDALLKAANEQKECTNCTALEEQLAATGKRFQEQIATGRQMLQDLNTEMEIQDREWKSSLVVEQRVTRETEERLKDVNGHNVMWENPL